MSKDFTIPQTTGDWIARTEKRMSSLERRDGSVGQIMTIIGPAQNKRAMKIGNWNDALAANNGYFWSRPGALHAPDDARVWTGSVVARTDNSGMQQVWNTDDLNDVLYYMRTFVDDGTGQGRTFSDWRNFATPTGFIELENFGDTITDLLAEMAADIDTAAVALSFYEQDEEPVPGVSGVPATLRVGSVWVDTDDSRHTYSWDGTAWVSIESTLFDAIDGQLSIMQAEIEAAATAASVAMDFAVSLTMVYRQASAPSNPDSNGRALVADDVWFDSDDDNRMYTWSGSAWVLLGISTEDYAEAQAAAATASAAAYTDSLIAGVDADTAAILARFPIQNIDIGDDQITAPKVAANQITSEHLTIGGLGSSMVRNGTFQDAGATPDVAIGWSTSGTANGGNAYREPNSATAPGSVMMVLHAPSSTAHVAIVGDFMPIDADQVYAVRGRFAKSGANATLVLRVLWFDSVGAYLGYSDAFFDVVSNDITTPWVTIAGQVSAATAVGGALPTAAYARVNLYNYLPAGGDSYLAAAEITFQPIVISTSIGENGVKTVNLDANAITAKHLMIAPTYKTTATVNRGILIDSTGLVTYNAASAATLTIDAATGAITMVGALTSGSTVTGAVVTGGTLQTEATAARGIKFNSSGMTVYDGSGGSVMTIVAATGAVTINGALAAIAVTGATVTGGIVQTTAAADQGIKITSAGLIAYDNAGVTQATLDSTTGVLTIAGGVLTGGSITGGIVTGATLQTVATAARGIKITGGGVVAYDSVETSPTVGQATLAINADTGEVDLLGKLTATAMTVLDGLSVRGTNNWIQGSVYIQSTIVSPTVAPTLTYTWRARAVGVQSGAVGLATHPTDSNLLTVFRNYHGTSAVFSLNKTTGASTTIADDNGDLSWMISGGWGSPTSFTYASGSYYTIHYVGSSLYVLRWSATTFALQGSLFIDTVANLNGVTIGPYVTTGVVVTGGDNAGYISHRAFNYDLTGLTTIPGEAILYPETGFFSGVYCGSADFGTAKWVVQGAASNIVRSAGMVDEGQGFPLAGGAASNSQGLCWDVGPTGDTNSYFWSLHYTGFLYRHGRNMTAETVNVGYSWRDNAGTVHETPIAAGATAVLVRPARTLLRVTTPLAPGSGSGAADSANMTGLYAITGTSPALTAYRLQDQAKVLGNATQQTGYSGVVSNVTVTVWDILEPTKTTGTAPQTTNGFDLISATGNIRSQSLVAGTSGWELKGDGSVNVGTFQMAASGAQVLGKNLADTGWITPTLLGAVVWVNYGAPYSTAAYRKINGVVYIKGLIKNGTATSGTTLFNLPAGFRPSAEMHMPQLISSGTDVGTMNIKANGDVVIRSGGNGFFSMDGQSFVAEQ